MPERRRLPALDNARKVRNPDLFDISNKNYTDTILRYAGLATKFPQLNTQAKTIVAAINELYRGGGGDGKHRTLTQAEYDELSEEEKNNGTIYFITDAPSIFIRPEDLIAGDALEGQFLAFYKSGNLGTWTATSKIRDLQDGDAIMWNAQYGTWVNGTISSGKSNLSELNDVNLSDLQSGQILKYNGTAWVNATEGDLSNYYTKSETDTLLEAKADVSDLPDMTDYYTKSATDTLLAGKANVGDIPEDIQDLDNVSISSASNGQVLTYNNGNWINANASGGASSLDELSDVDITSAQSGQILKYDGTDWVNAAESTGSTVSVTQIQSTGTKIATIEVDGVDTDLYSPNGGGSPSALDDLTDVTINTPTNGQVLTYDNGNWINSNASGSATALDDLTDVSISSVTDSQVLTYDSNSGEWVNESLPSIPEDITDLSDVSVTSASNGQVLKYNNGTWENANETTGSTVSVTQIQSTGTKIATISVDSVDTDLYAPNGGGSGGTAADITFDDTNVEFVADDVQEAFEVITKTLTTAEYNNLSSAEKNNGTIYLITDSEVSYPDLDELDNVNITSVTNGQLLKYDSATSKWVNGTGTSTPWVEVTGQLTASQTSVTLSDESITTDSTIDVYVDDSFYRVNPTAVTLATGSVTLTFEAQSSNMPVKVRVS